MTVIRDEVLGIVRPKSSRSFIFELKLPDGMLTGIFEVEPNEKPSEQQLNLMRTAVTNADDLKRLAVVFVRQLVLTEPEQYGLLEEDAQPCSWTAPYFSMTEAEYFEDFRLASLEVVGSMPDHLFAGYSTKLDPEHGVPVMFKDGVPVEAFA